MYTGETGTGENVFDTIDIKSDATVSATGRSLQEWPKSNDELFRQVLEAIANRNRPSQMILSYIAELDERITALEHGSTRSL